MITTKQYIDTMRKYYDRKIKMEVIFILTFGFIVSLLAVFGGARLIMLMVDKGWIN